MEIPCYACGVECSCDGYCFFIGPRKTTLSLCELCYITLRTEIYNLELGEMYSKLLNSFKKDY